MTTATDKQRRKLRMVMAVSRGWECVECRTHNPSWRDRCRECGLVHERTRPACVSEREAMAMSEVVQWA